MDAQVQFVIWKGPEKSVEVRLFLRSGNAWLRTKVFEHIPNGGLLPNRSVTRVPQ